MADYTVYREYKVRRDTNAPDNDSGLFKVAALTGADATPKTAFDAWWGSTPNVDRGDYLLERTDATPRTVNHFRLRNTLTSSEL